jgi:hypothetical protein
LAGKLPGFCGFCAFFRKILGIILKMKSSAHCILSCGLIRLTVTLFGFLKKNTTQLREVGNLVKVKLYE